MPIQPGPHDLDRVRYILGPDGGATAKPVTPSFYEEIGKDFGSFAGHVLVRRYAFDSDWPTWEMHPKGDEFVYLLSGDTDVVLRVDGRDEVLRVATPGHFVVVPRGTWHTARPHTRTEMLFVTPGEGTLNAETPES